MSELMESFCHRLPKVELHAHLNGSLSDSLLESICTSQSRDFTEKCWSAAIRHGDKRSLDECFEIFNIVHSVTTSPTVVKFATVNVIKEFADDNVMYLELRTTPRSVQGTMSKNQYVNAVLDGIMESQNNNITVKLLISLDRSKSVQEAEENLQEALKARDLYPGVLVGIDLSGNPNCGSIEDFLPILHKARAEKLKITLHCGEVANEREVLKMIEFSADRLGHGTCIHPTLNGSDKLWRSFIKYKTPLEVCLTSNVKCCTVKSYESHHIKHLLPLSYPVAVSTDDKGVFATSLSKEYEICAKTFNLNENDIFSLVQMAIDASFATIDEKKVMLQKLNEFKKDC